MRNRTGQCRGHRGSWLSIGWLVVLLHSTTFAATSEIPQLRKYRAGEKADIDIITPIRLVAKNPTPGLDAVDYPTRVFLYYPQAGAEAEMRLREAIDRTRSDFLENLYLASKHRQLTPEQTTHPGFEHFAAWFQNRHKEFPFSAAVARAWATGTSDDDFQSDLALKLREGLKGYVVPMLPEDPRQVRLVPVEAGQSSIIPDEAVKRALPVDPSYLHSLAEARARINGRVGSNNVAAGQFISRFLRENCVFDVALTRAFAARSAPNPLVEISYQPGQTIVRRGDTIDPNAEAAIELLRSMRATQERARTVEEWKKDLRSVGTELQGFFAQAGSAAELLWLRHPIPVSTAASALVLLVGVLLLRRQTSHQRSTRVVGKESAYTVIFNAARNETIFLPMKTESSPRLILRDTIEPAESVSEPQPVVSVDLEWQNRVAATEQRAEALLADVRAGLAPHLAKEMMNELVRKLVADREGLMQANDIAASEVARLERRFTKVHGELQYELKEYQLRTLELQKQLQARTEQNRELLRSQIEALQKKTH